MLLCCAFSQEIWRDPHSRRGFSSRVVQVETAMVITLDEVVPEVGRPLNYSGQPISG